MLIYNVINFINLFNIDQYKNTHDILLIKEAMLLFYWDWIELRINHANLITNNFN